MERACPACGEAVKPQWKMCPMCGKQLAQEKKSADKAATSHAPSTAELFREFELIPPSELEWGEQLGEGSYGVVFRGKVRGTPVALKSVKSLEQTLHKSGDAREERLMQAKINKQLEVLKQVLSCFFFCFLFFAHFFFSRSKTLCARVTIPTFYYFSERRATRAAIWCWCRNLWIWI
jgi:hypothetical protein